MENRQNKAPEGGAVMLAVFSSAMNERKREFAAYRILGADRATLVGIIVKESATPTNHQATPEWNYY